VVWGPPKNPENLVKFWRVDFEIFRKRIDPGLYVYIGVKKTNTESIYSVGYSFTTLESWILVYSSGRLTCRSLVSSAAV